MRVLATAGHVDHGKSTLVLALTGTDPDRFAEEKARGMTIDLGFASAALDGGEEIAFVDVPGHVRFLKNMLAGVGAVDACLFVIDAAEGWKPQSEEHLRILELLGMTHGVVALTKVDTVDHETLELARLDVADHTAGTFLEDAEVVPVAAPTGRGLDDLRAALLRLVRSTPAAVDRDRPRLWVDRSFAAKGSGTVVTGTLTGGSLHVGEDVVVEPGGRRARVRALQTHQRPTDAVGPGHRVAVNLVGVAHRDVVRGDALVRGGEWHLTTTFDATLSVLGSLDHDVSRRGAYVAYVGSGEVPASLRILGTAALPPGGSGFVRVRLARAVPLLPGDHFILRESGRSETVGGGEVLDVEPVLPAARARPDGTIERVVRERGWVDAQELERLTGRRAQANVAGRWVVDGDVLAAAREAVRERVRTAGALGLDAAKLDERERAIAEDDDALVVDGGRVRPADTDDADLGGHPFVRALEAAPFAPPLPGPEVDRAVVRELVRRGLVVEREGLYFAPSAVEAAAATLARLLDAQPDGVTVSQIREALGTTRKWAMPLIAHLDATGVTRRRGEVRVAGPRLPR